METSNVLSSNFQCAPDWQLPTVPNWWLLSVPDWWLPIAPNWQLPSVPDWQLLIAPNWWLLTAPNWQLLTVPSWQLPIAPRWRLLRVTQMRTSERVMRMSKCVNSHSHIYSSKPHWVTLICIEIWVDSGSSYGTPCILHTYVLSMWMCCSW